MNQRWNRDDDRNGGRSWRDEGWRGDERGGTGDRGFSDRGGYGYGDRGGYGDDDRRFERGQGDRGYGDRGDANRNYGDRSYGDRSFGGGYGYGEQGPFGGEGGGSRGRGAYEGRQGSYGPDHHNQGGSQRERWGRGSGAQRGHGSQGGYGSQGYGNEWDERGYSGSSGYGGMGGGNYAGGMGGGGFGGMTGAGYGSGGGYQDMGRGNRAWSSSDEGGSYGRSGYGESGEYGQSTRGQGGGMGGMGGGMGRRGMHAGKGPRGFVRNWDRVREDINEALEQDDEIDASNVEVRVENGEVTLSGTVDDREQKRAAERIVERMRGVRDVQNLIRVQQQSESRGSESENGGRMRSSSDQSSRTTMGRTTDKGNATT